MTNKTRNHPVFYANCISKKDDENGIKHTSGDTVQVTCTADSDQTGIVTGAVSTVKLIGPKDNMYVSWRDESALTYPIGEYGDSKLEYLALKAKKYTDTATYEDPYIELTGDACALLNKVTYETTITLGSKTTTTHLVLRGYRLDNGDWVDVSADEAAALLNATGGYYDLTSKIPSGRYLTGLRLAPLELNNTAVDTTTAPTEVDPLDGETKYYQEDTYYLYIYDQVLPDVLGYNNTLGQTYQAITALNSCLTYDVSFHCDYADARQARHLYGTDDKKTSTFIFGDLPEKIYGRDNDYDVATSVGGSGNYLKYNVTELTNVAMDDGPASASTNLAWGEMNSATLKFGNTTAEEKRMLALTKGVSLVGANWQGAGYLEAEGGMRAVVRYKTNKSSDWITPTLTTATRYGADRAVTYFTLADDEYITALEVDYPEDFMYESGYGVNVKETATTRGKQIPDVGLLTNGPIAAKSPVEGDSHIFYNGEQLDYSASLSYTDLSGTEHSGGDLTLNYKTARLVPYPTMLVDNYTASVAYDGVDVYQGNVVNATITQAYQFTTATAAIDADKKIHPTLCFQIDKNFTIADIDALATSLGVNVNQITLTAKNDGSGDGILRIEYGAEDPQTRAVSFTTALPLTAKPGADTTSAVTPIKNCWLTLDYDTGLDVTQEGEYVAVNPDSSQLEADPAGVISDWTSSRKALTTATATPTINILINTSESVFFKGTNGNGGGFNQVVSGRNGTDNNVFGMTETLTAPSGGASSNWVVYVAIPKKGQQVPYNTGTTSQVASDYSLSANGELSVDPITGATMDTAYFIPNTGATMPSMAGLSLESGDTTATIKTRDTTADTSNGVWKTWANMTDSEKEKASYVRVIVDEVPANAKLTSLLMMKLSPSEPKTQVDEESAYTSLVYNYMYNGSMAFPKSVSTNRTETNGHASDYVQYKLTDFMLSGQLWYEKNFNNTYVAADGDVLEDHQTGGVYDITVTLVDADGNPVTHTDGSAVTVTINSDGSYTVPVPSHGTYYLTMTSNQKDWLPVDYSDAVINGMKYHAGVDKDGNTIAANIATATVAVTNNDVPYINGGIEQWGTLKISKAIGATDSGYADLTKAFSFSVTPAAATIDRTYAAKWTKPNGTIADLSLEGGSNNAFSLGQNGTLTVSLPVGLAYNVTETGDNAYTTTVETVENGVTQSTETVDSVDHTVKAITYTNAEGDGGNEEKFVNTRTVVIPSGVNMDDWTIVTLIALVILAGIAGFVVNRKLKIKTRGR